MVLVPHRPWRGSKVALQLCSPLATCAHCSRLLGIGTQLCLPAAGSDVGGGSTFWTWILDEISEIYVVSLDLMSNKNTTQYDMDILSGGMPRFLPWNIETNQRKLCRKLVKHWKKIQMLTHWTPSRKRHLDLCASIKYRYGGVFNRGL